MASVLASSTTQFHRDMRSESKPFKRDRESSSKWAHGVRGANNIDAITYGTQFPDGAPVNYKVRPDKGLRDTRNFKHNTKSHANITRGNARDLGKAGNRIVRKNASTYDSAHGAGGLSNSLFDLLPAASPVSVYASVDDGVIYSFDKASPRQALGLEGLVEKAEKEWKGKETDRLVKTEWEVLDVDLAGEPVLSVKGGTKAKGKRSPMQKPVLVVEEEDWECI